MLESLTPLQQELYDYIVWCIQSQGGPPNVREMMKAMKLRSPAPIQSRLKHLVSKGWITTVPGQARSIRLTQTPERGIPIYGSISAGGLTTTEAEVGERLDIPSLIPTGAYAVVMDDDSMIEAHIGPGDVVLVKPVERHEVKDGDIVAVTVRGRNRITRYFRQNRNVVNLVAANANHQSDSVSIHAITRLGVICAVWRNIQHQQV